MQAAGTQLPPIVQRGKLPELQPINGRELKQPQAAAPDPGSDAGPRESNTEQLAEMPAVENKLPAIDPRESSPAAAAAADIKADARAAERQIPSPDADVQPASADETKSTASPDPSPTPPRARSSASLRGQAPGSAHSHRTITGLAREEGVAESHLLQGLSPNGRKKAASQVMSSMESIWPGPYSRMPHDWLSYIPTEPKEALASVVASSKLKVFTCTWNMHAHAPPRDLNSLLPVGRFHIYAIGSEECENSIAKSIFVTLKKRWEAQLTSTLGSEYVKLGSQILQAIHLIVFVHKSLMPVVSDVQSRAVATGMGKRLGNKGAVAISFQVGKTSLLFINAHFQAHHNNIKGRNKDYKMIEKQLTNAPSVSGRRSKYVSDRFDRTVFMGDLNYRINGMRRGVDVALERNMHNVLWFNDQLRREIEADRVFSHFDEAPVNFRPTYKFDRGTDTYDTSTKARIPGWTDRILFRPAQAAVMKCVYYNSVDEIKTSDHRPVVAYFDVGLRRSHQPEPLVWVTRQRLARRSLGESAADATLARQVGASNRPDTAPAATQRANSASDLPTTNELSGATPRDGPEYTASDNIDPTHPVGRGGRPQRDDLPPRPEAGSRRQSTSSAAGSTARSGPKSGRRSSARVMPAESASLTGNGSVETELSLVDDEAASEQGGAAGVEGGSEKQARGGGDDQSDSDMDVGSVHSHSDSIDGTKPARKVRMYTSLRANHGLALPPTVQPKNARKHNRKVRKFRKSRQDAQLNRGSTKSQVCAIM